jgi:hypothetical protein
LNTLLESMLSKRVHVIKEIISTEQIYIRRLKMTLEAYAYPIKSLRILDNADYVKQFEILVRYTMCAHTLRIFGII